jgi:hypothetical protein
VAVNPILAETIGCGQWLGDALKRPPNGPFQRQNPTTLYGVAGNAQVIDKSLDVVLELVLPRLLVWHACHSGEAL